MRRPSARLVGLMAIAALAVAGCGSTESGGSERPAAGSSSSSYSYSESSTGSATSSSAGSGSQSGGSGAYGEGPPTTGASGGTTSVAVVGTKSNKVYGEILTAGSENHTVYMFAKDTGGASTCTGTCAGVWPPLTTTGPPKAIGGAIASKLGTITRAGGEKQVTYAGHPLYYYVTDKTEKDVLGEGVVSFGAAWYMLSPAGKVIKKP